MLQKPILSGRVGKWAYALVEYDLHCEPIKLMRGPIVANFIVEHRIDKKLDLDVDYVTFTPWKFHFDGSACRSNVVLRSLLFHPVELFSKPLIRKTINALIIKFSMKLSCLVCKFYMTWE
jgi:hypothetical protein